MSDNVSKLLSKICQNLSTYINKPATETKQNLLTWSDSRLRAETEQSLLYNLTTNCSAKIKQDLSLSYTAVKYWVINNWSVLEIKWLSCLI